MHYLTTIILAELDKENYALLSNDLEIKHRFIILLSTYMYHNIHQIYDLQ